MPGIPELLIILAIVTLLFGAGKLPALGDAVGRTIKNFKRASTGANELEAGVLDAKEIGTGDHLPHGELAATSAGKEA